MVNVMQLGHPETILHPLPRSVEELSSMKWVPDAKKVGDHYPRVLHGPWWVESKDRETWVWSVFNCAEWLGETLFIPHSFKALQTSCKVLKLIDL